MYKLIEKLRAKPEKKREGIVLAVSVSITLVILAFWIIALVIRIQNGAFVPPPKSADSAKIEASTAAVRNSWNAFVDTIHNVANQFAASTTSATSTMTQAEIQEYEAVVGTSTDTEGNIQ